MAVNIHQIYFKEEQVARLDKAFIHYDNSLSENSHLYEFDVMLNLFKEKKLSDDDYLGVFSYKFGTKTNIKGEKFIRFMNDNPGYDVYFINPYPHYSYFYYNILEQGELWHHGLNAVCERLFKRIGVINDNSIIPRHSSKSLCFCNFWVGNKLFIDLFYSIMVKIKCLMETDKEIKDMLLSTTFHANGSAPLFPFMFERLFSILLSVRDEFSVLSYEHHDEEIYASCSYDFEREELRKRKLYIDRLDDSGLDSELKCFFDKESPKYHSKLRKKFEEKFPENLL